MGALPDLGGRIGWEYDPRGVNQLGRGLDQVVSALGGFGGKLKSIFTESNKTATAVDKTSDALKRQENELKSFGDGLNKHLGGLDALQKKLSLLSSSGLANIAGSMLSGLAQMGQGIARFSSESVGAFARYDQMIRQSGTLSGDMAKHIDYFSDAVGRLAVDMGQDAVQSAHAMYDAVSSGVPAAKVIEFLGIAAKTAVAGMTDIGSAGDLLTTVMNAWHVSVDGLSQASDILFNGVNIGKTTIEELGASIYEIAPLAGTMHVGLADIVSALSTITKSGTPSAQAFTQIRSAMADLLNPSETLQALMEKAGGTLPELMAKYGSFQAVLQKLFEISSAGGQDVALAFDRIEAKNAVWALVGENARGAAEDLKAIKETAGSTENAYNIMADSADFSLKRIKSAFEDGFIRIGGIFWEAFGPILKAFADILPSAIDVTVLIFKTLAEHMDVVAVVAGGLAGIILGIAIVIGGPLVVAIWSAAAAFLGLNLASGGIIIAFGLIGAALALLAVMFYKSVDEAGGIWLWLTNIISWGADNAIKVVDWFVGGVMSLITWMTDGSMESILSFVNFGSNAFTWLVSMVGPIIDIFAKGVLGSFGAVGNGVYDALKWMAERVFEVFNWLLDTGKTGSDNFGEILFGGFKSGVLSALGPLGTLVGAVGDAMDGIMDYVSRAVNFLGPVLGAAAVGLGTWMIGGIRDFAKKIETSIFALQMAAAMANVAVKAQINNLKVASPFDLAAYKEFQKTGTAPQMSFPGRGGGRSKKEKPDIVPGAKDHDERGDFYYDEFGEKVYTSGVGLNKQNRDAAEREAKAGKKGAKGGSKAGGKSAVEVVADMAQTTAEALKAGVGAIQALAGAQIPARDTWQPKLDLLESFFVVLFDGLQKMAVKAADDLELMGEASPVLGELLDAVKSGIDIASSLIKIKWPADSVFGSLESFLTRLIDSAKSVTKKVTSEEVDLLGVVAGPLGDWFTSLTNAVEFGDKLKGSDLSEKALGGWQYVVGIVDRVAVLASKWVTRVRNATENNDVLAEQIFALGSSIAGFFGGWIESLGGIAELAKSLSGLVPVTNGQFAIVDMVLDNLAAMASKWVTRTRSVIKDNDEAIAAILKLAESLSKMFVSWADVVSPIAELSSAIANIKPVSDSAFNIISGYLDDLALLAARWVTRVRTASDNDDKAAEATLGLASSVADLFNNFVGLTSNVVEFSKTVGTVKKSTVTAFDAIREYFNIFYSSAKFWADAARETYKGNDAAAKAAFDLGISVASVMSAFAESFARIASLSSDVNSAKSITGRAYVAITEFMHDLFDFAVGLSEDSRILGGGTATERGAKVDLASKVVGLVSAAIEGVSSAVALSVDMSAEVKTISAAKLDIVKGNIRSVLQTAYDVSISWVSWLSDAAKKLGIAEEKQTAEDFTASLNSLAEIIGPAADILNGAFAFTPGNDEIFARDVELSKRNLERMIYAAIEIVYSLDQIIDQVNRLTGRNMTEKDYADLFSRFTNMISPASEILQAGLEDISDKAKPISEGTIETARKNIAAMFYGVFSLASDWETIMNHPLWGKVFFGGRSAADIEKLIENFRAMVGPAIETISDAFSVTDTSKVITQTDINRAQGNLKVMISGVIELADWWQAFVSLRGLFDGMQSRTSDFVDRVKEFLDIASPAIEVIKLGFTDFGKVTELTDSALRVAMINVDRAVRAVVFLAEAWIKFVNSNGWAEILTQGKKLDELTKDVKAFEEIASPALSIIIDALDAGSKEWGEVTEDKAKSAARSTDQILKAVIRLAIDFANNAASLVIQLGRDKTIDDLQNALDRYVDMAKGAIGLLGDALDVFVKLGEYNPETKTDVKGKRRTIEFIVEDIKRNIKLIISAMAGVLEEVGEEALLQASLVGQRVSPIADAISKIIDPIIKLMDNPLAVTKFGSDWMTRTRTNRAEWLAGQLKDGIVRAIKVMADALNDPALKNLTIPTTLISELNTMLSFYDRLATLIERIAAINFKKLDMQQFVQVVAELKALFGSLSSGGASSGAPPIGQPSRPGTVGGSVVPNPWRYRNPVVDRSTQFWGSGGNGGAMSFLTPDEMRNVIMGSGGNGGAMSFLTPDEMRNVIMGSGGNGGAMSLPPRLNRSTQFWGSGGNGGAMGFDPGQTVRKIDDVLGGVLEDRLQKLTAAASSFAPAGSLLPGLAPTANSGPYSGPQTDSGGGVQFNFYAPVTIDDDSEIGKTLIGVLHEYNLP